MRARIVRSPVSVIIGALIAVAVGVIIMVTLHPPGARTQTGGVVTSTDVGDSAAAPGQGGGTAEAQAPIGEIPSALDAKWAALSAGSNCAGWAGGDGISAVRLNSTQVAWFFSDTYLGPAGPIYGFSKASGLIHNSVVIQTTSSKGSRFTTVTGGNACSQTRPPVSVVAPPQAPGRQNTRYWAEGGIKVGSTVVEFYNRYSPGNIPYVAQGTVIATYSAGELAAAGEHPSPDPVAVPTLTPLPYYVPPAGATPIVWGAAVMRSGNTAYLYGTELPDTHSLDRKLFLARVPVSELTDFSSWRFYAGAGHWTDSQQDAKPVQPGNSTPLNVSTGFSVLKAGNLYWLIQANPIAGSQDIDAYPAATPWGPFDATAKVVLYSDPGIGLNAADDYRLIYEARVETAVSPSGTLIISYNVNSTGISRGCTPMSWFDSTVTVPRFVSVPLATLTSGGSGLAGGTAYTAAGVTAGPPDYPQVASHNPAQWSNEWDYKTVCPQIPGLSTASATARSGSVTLSWPDVGLGLAYQVYLRGPGATGYVLAKTVLWVMNVPEAVSTTVSGLPAGKYQARVVPLNLSLKKGKAAEVSFTVP